jgi:hypothetical protein
MEERLDREEVIDILDWGMARIVAWTCGSDSETIPSSMGGLSSDRLDPLEVPKERATEAVWDRSNIAWTREYRMAKKQKSSGRYGVRLCSLGEDNRRSVLNPLGYRLLRLRSSSETRVMSA